MVLDPNGDGAPTEAEISILVQGDDTPTGRLGWIPRLEAAAFNEIHQPDNLETTPARQPPYNRGHQLGNNNYSLPPAPARRRQGSGRCRSPNPEAGKVPLLAVDQALDENGPHARRG